MWQWLSLLALSLFLCSPIQPSFSAPTDLGPTSDEEGAILWEEGISAANEGHYQEGVTTLQRLIDRYPAHAHYLEAHYLLGQAYLRLHSTQKALRPLKYCVTASGVKVALKLKCQLELSRAYLDLKQFHEAYLLTREAEKLKMAESHPWVHYPIVLNQVEALLGLSSAKNPHNEDHAAKTLALTLQQLPADTPAQISSQASLLQLQVKIKQCDHLPSKGPLDEGQFRDQVERKGTCLMEAVLLFRNTLEKEDLRTSKLAAQEVSGAFQSYWRLCLNPSPSLLKKDKKSTALEQQRFRAELIDSVNQNCKRKLLETVELTAPWKESIPKTMQESINQFTKTLEGLHHES